MEPVVQKTSLPDETDLLCPYCGHRTVHVTDAKVLSVDHDTIHLNYRAWCGTCGRKLERSHMVVPMQDAFRMTIQGDIDEYARKHPDLGPNETGSNDSP